MIMKSLALKKIREFENLYGSNVEKEKVDVGGK
jgi:hypothetical protein